MSMESFNAFAQAAEAIGPRLIVYEGIQEALTLMDSLTVNEGQAVIYDKYIVPAFKEEGIQVMSGTDYSWDGVVIDDYMDAVGEIVEAGNDIMVQACEEATELEEELEAVEAAIFIASRGTVGSFSDIIADAFD